MDAVKTDFELKISEIYLEVRISRFINVNDVNVYLINLLVHADFS